MSRVWRQGTRRITAEGCRGATVNLEPVSNTGHTLRVHFVARSGGAAWRSRGVLVGWVRRTHLGPNGRSGGFPAIGGGVLRV